MSYQKQESRYFNRVEVKVNATLNFADETSLAATVRDLSMVGLFVHCAQHKDIGKECDVVLHLDGSATNPAIRVDAKGIVARLTDDGMAIEFTHLIGDDSYNLLRQIVIRYSADPVKAERELNDPHQVIKEEQAD